MAILTPTADRDASTLRDGECDHRLRVVGRVSVGSRLGDGLDCDQPLRVVCLDCDHLTAWRCDSYRCVPCGETKRRRLMRVIEDGSVTHLAGTRRGYFITLTAPGSRDHLRWYQGRRPTSRPSCDCHDHGMTLGRWNAQESACWNRLRTSLARGQEVVFIGSVETQERGALHRHLIVFTDQALDHLEVQALALAAGYGCVLDIEPLESASKAARYLAKYVTKSSTGRADVPWEVQVVDDETGEVTDERRPATYRLWSSAQSWGVTMKQVRDAAAQQARARARYLSEYAAALAEDSPGGNETPPPPTARGD